MTEPEPVAPEPRPSRAGTGPAQPRASALSRFLWFCAGADAHLLQRCPGSDRVKFEGIGGIVLATAVLAFASGSYAFYTVFEPKDDTALGRDLDPRTTLFAIAAGLVWSLVIFNIDRFIVSSSGKGDGTDRITLAELGQSAPRLLLALIIGVCISAPLEIRILKPEIDAQLELEQNEYLRKLDKHSEEQIQSKRDLLNDKIGAASKRLEERAAYFEKRRLEIKEQRRLLEQEAEGTTASGVAGRGPAWRDKKDTLDQMMVELERDQDRDAAQMQPVKDEIERHKKDLATINAELDAAHVSNLKQARHLDGLMKRIHISHEIGGFVPIFILLLLLAIETGPIFFKMMLVKGAYDYMQENEKRIAVAHAGVEADAQLYLPESQEEIRYDVFHQAEAAMAEERRRLQSEAELAERVHQRFRQETAKDVAEGEGYKKYVEPRG
jgi:hypothetical protein